MSVARTNATPDTVIFPNGNVGIGAEPPAVKLHVQQTGEGNTLRIQDSDGTCNQDPDSGSLVTSCSSDEKLKEDITDSGSALEYFEDIKVRDYVVKASGDTQTGVIAQELMETHPELVHRVDIKRDDGSDDDIEILLDISKSGNGTKVYGAEAREGEDGELFVEQPNPWKLLKGIQELKEMFDSLVGGNYSVDSMGMIIDEDSVGTAVIPVNSTEISVKFSEEYEVVPVVTVTPREFIDGQYKVAEETTKGFVIVLQKVQNVDIGFNWHAFAQPKKEVEIRINDTITNETIGDSNDTIDKINETEPIEEIPELNETIEDINDTLDEGSESNGTIEDIEKIPELLNETTEENQTEDGSFVIQPVEDEANENQSDSQTFPSDEGSGNESAEAIEDSASIEETPQPNEEGLTEEVDTNEESITDSEEEIIPEETSVQQEESQVPTGGSLITGGVIGVNEEQGNRQGIFDGLFERLFGMIFDLIDGEDE